MTWAPRDLSSFGAHIICVVCTRKLLTQYLSDYSLSQSILSINSRGGVCVMFRRAWPIRSLFPIFRNRVSACTYGDGFRHNGVVEFYSVGFQSNDT